MRTLSASQLKLYRSCRQQYYDKYINKPPDAVDIEDTSGLLGTGIHKAIELYYKEEKPPIPTFMQTVRTTLTEWQDSGKLVNYHYSHAEIIDQGLEILNKFNFSQFKPKYNELSFNLPFYDICKIRGFIDLITEDDVVVDFKTAKRKPKDLQKDPQFMIYAWAHFQLFGKWPKSVIWYHLRSAEILEFKFEWNAFDAIAVQTAKEITLDDFSDLQGIKCSTCSPWCPRYRQVL